MSNTNDYIDEFVPEELRGVVKDKVENARETVKESVAKILEEFEKIAHEAWKESYPNIDNQKLEHVYHLGLFLEFQRALTIKYGATNENQSTG